MIAIIMVDETNHQSTSLLENLPLLSEHWHQVWIYTFSRSSGKASREIICLAIKNGLLEYMDSNCVLRGNEDVRDEYRIATILQDIECPLDLKIPHYLSYSWAQTWKNTLLLSDGDDKRKMIRNLARAKLLNKIDNYFIYQTNFEEIYKIAMNMQ